MSTVRGLMSEGTSESVWTSAKTSKAGDPANMALHE